MASKSFFMRVAVFLLLVLTCIHASAQPSDWTPTGKQRLRALIEKDIKLEFETQSRNVTSAAQDKKASDRDLKLSIGGLQITFYNKAYWLYTCTLEGGGSVEKAGACVSRWMQEGENYVKFMSGNRLGPVPNRHTACELETRLVKAEVEFPPFPFLVGAHLFDFRKMNECLRR